MKCQYCGADVDLPFRCQFCGGYYCADHRLLENHECPEMWQTKLREPPSAGTRPPRYVEAKLKNIEARSPQKRILRVDKAGWTSSTEIIHLTASSLIIMAIGLSWDSPQLEWVYRLFSDPVGLLAWGAFFTAVFLTHELAHKATAKRYGLWAEFRMSAIGVAFTMLSIMSPLKIISPGAVIIGGVANRKNIGKTALAGPLTSIVVACILLGVYFFVPGGSSALAVFQGAFLSAWIAFFNLIPLAMLDGAKIFGWNKAAWAASFAVALALAMAMLMF